MSRANRDKNMLRRAALPATAAAIVLAAALWAFAPLSAYTDAAAPTPESLKKITPNHANELVALDRSAFSAPLWIAPPPPAPPPSPAPVAAVPPLKIQLLAIIKEDAKPAHDGSIAIVYKAMVYDPDTDKVLVVAAGESVGTGGRTVESIDESGLKIKDGRGSRLLTIKSEGGAR